MLWRCCDDVVDDVVHTTSVHSAKIAQLMSPSRVKRLEPQAWRLLGKNILKNILKKKEERRRFFSYYLRGLGQKTKQKKTINDVVTM